MQVHLKIRNTKDKDERTKLKTSLPSVVFGGIYKNKVKKANLVEKTGLIGLDIDGLDVSELNQVRKTLQNDPATTYGPFSFLRKHKPL